MAVMQLRQQAINYLDTLDDEQTLRVITFMETMPRKEPFLQNSKTPEERKKAELALNELFTMSRPAEHEISLDGKKEVAEALLKKYESLD